MSSENIFALSKVPQSNYQTPLTPSTTPKNFRQVEKTDRQFANFTTRTQGNKGYSNGKNHDTRREGLEDDVEFSMTEDASSQLLGERALAGFGSVETEEVVEDEVYKHLFKLLDKQQTAQQPAYDYVEKAGESVSRPNAHNKRYPSVVAGQTTFRGQGTSKLQVSTSWTGSGKRIKPSSVSFATNVQLLTEAAQNYFKNTQADFTLYPERDLGGTPYVVGCDFREFECVIDQDLQKNAGYLGCGKFQDQVNPDSNAIRGNCEVGDNQSVRMTFLIIAKDGYDPQDIMMDVESISAEMAYIGKTITGAHKHKALWRLLGGNIVSCEHTISDGKNAWRITLEPLGDGLVLPVELELTNDVKSYTTLADTW